MPKHLSILIILVLTMFCSHGQNDILVELNDSETNEPVAYATIKFKGTSRALVSDYYGQFRLPYRSIDSLPVVIISSMGYETTEINTKTLSLKELNTIKLRPQIESLDAVVLNVAKRDKPKSLKIESSIKNSKTMSAFNIVDKAVNSVPNNLSTTPHSYIGYYRDYQMVKGEYNNLNESILEQFDAGISTNNFTNHNNQNVIYSFNQNLNYNVDKDLAVAYNERSKYIESASINGFGGNELSILNVHNPIRNYNQNTFSFVYHLNKEFLANHSFDKSDIAFVEDEAVIKILFSKKKINNQDYDNMAATGTVDIKNQLRVRGSISISLQDFSIHDFSYKVFDGNRQNPLFTVQIEYRRHDAKMYLNYITFNNRFVYENKKVFRETDVAYNHIGNTYDVEFNNRIDTTTVNSKNFRIKYNGKKIPINNVKVTSSTSVRIYLDDLPASFDKTNLLDADFEIKRLKNVNGSKIYKATQLTAYQFREFFVQEVFTDNPVKSDLRYSLKLKPLADSPVNYYTDNVSNYIINSPLKTKTSD